MKEHPGTEDQALYILATSMSAFDKTPSEDRTNFEKPLILPGGKSWTESGTRIWSKEWKH